MTQSDVSVVSDGARLAGTLVVPERAKGVVLLVHGSGPMDRDQNSATARLETFSHLADQLAQAGFASLRWDKRGIGASEGDYQALRQAQLVADVRAWVGLVRDIGPVFLLGHSEGTAIAPAAAEGLDIAGFVLLCPYITQGGDILIQQAGRADRMVETMPGVKGALTRFAARIMGRPSQMQARFVRRLKRTQSDTLRVGFRKVPVQWLRDFVTSDVHAIHASNARPTLIVVAEHDAQCPPGDGARIAALNPHAELVEIAGLSHILRATDTKDLNDYARQLQTPNDPRVARAVVDWLMRQV